MSHQAGSGPPIGPAWRRSSLRIVRESHDRRLDVRLRDEGQSHEQVEGRSFMIWQDVVVRLPLDDEAIVRGLAAGFGINPNEVLVHRGADDFPEPDGAKVVCVVSERAEGFRCVMSLYTFLDSLRGDDPVAVVQQFAKVVQTECLVTDDSPDPYSMIRVLATGEIGKVNLDMQRLDDKGEYSDDVLRRG